MVAKRIDKLTELFLAGPVPQEADLVFVTSPVVHFASNRFINVPVILQYADTPLIEVVRGLDTYEPRTNLYSSDGTQIAVVKGARLFLTREGEKAGLVIRHPDRMTVCELKGQPLIELRRQGAAAVSIDAELYTPDGAFVRCRGRVEGQVQASSRGISAGPLFMSGCQFAGCDVGVWVQRDGSVRLASTSGTSLSVRVT